MGYGFAMVMDAGANLPVEICDLGNMTYNVGPMFSLALTGSAGGPGIGSLSGKTGAELIPVLEKAVAHISNPNNVDAYAALTPPNKWGSHGGARKKLEEILDGCRSYPKAVFEVS